jgi:hypothetical protein
MSRCVERGAADACKVRGREAQRETDRETEREKQ